MPHCLLLCSLFLITSADAPKPDAAKALAVVVKGFNDGEDPKELHALLTKDFQKELPLPALRAVLQKVWRHYGKIVGEPASSRLVRPKNLGPDQCVPVIWRATSVRLR